MNETSQQVNSTETVRMGRDLQSPFLNLILAASLLSKLTTGKSHLKNYSWPQQYRPSFYGQLPQRPLFWYPFDAQHYNKLYTSLNANQANFPIKQHIIHIHQTPSKDIDENTIEDKNTSELPHLSNNSTGESQSTNLGNLQVDLNHTKSSDVEDTLRPSNLTEELKEFLVQFFTKNFTLPFIKDAGVEPEISETEQVSKSTVTEEDNFPTTDSNFLVINETTRIPDIEVAESSVDLQAAEANIKRRTQIPQNYDYAFARGEDDEEEDDDLIEITLPQKLRLRSTTEAAVTKKPPQRPRVQSTRINSKKPSHAKPKRTTPIALIYEDEDYEVMTTLPSRRKTYNQNGPKRNNIRRTTTPSNEDDEYEEPKRRRVTTRRRTSTTTPTYDYYDADKKPNTGKNKNTKGDDYYSMDYQYDQDQYQEEDDKPNKNVPKRKPNFQQRQQDITAATEFTTDTDVTDTDITTIETTLPPTTMSPKVTNATSGEYPYYGNNNHDHISITYGPPVHHNHGYGPSNGNDHISITYAPPSSGGNSGPLLDTWYNQYAKASMFQRIQDLLTPNNYYNQYDINYNDGSL